MTARPRPIDRATARLFLVRRHLLAPPRSLPAGPDSVMTVFERLGSIQFDPLEVAGRNHDVVLLARVAGYRREMTEALLYGQDRRLFEAYNKGLSLLPLHELPWFRLTWDRNRERHEGETFRTHAALVDEILDRIRREGPLSSIDFDSRAVIEWKWRPTNQVRAIFEALGDSGILGFARRQGNRRYYDLAERLFPAELLAHRPTTYEQRRHRLLSRFRGHGLLGRTGSAELWMTAAPAKPSAGYDGPLRGELIDDLVAAGELVAVTVDGVRGERFVLAEEVALLDEAERDVAAVGGGTVAAGGHRGGGEGGAGRGGGGQPADDGWRHDPDTWQPLDPARSGVALLAPLDPFVWDRDFLRALFDFDYLWEVYVPEQKRRWGYYVLPILWGDRLVGRIEPRIDRTSDALRILSVYWEDGFDPARHPAFPPALAEAIEAHRAFAGVGRVVLPRTAAGTALRRVLGDRLPAIGRAAGAARAGRPARGNRGTPGAARGTAAGAAPGTSRTAAREPAGDPAMDPEGAAVAAATSPTRPSG